MRKTFKYKLYNSKHNKHLHSQVDIAASIYNHCIALHRRYYRLYNKSLNYYTLKKHLTKLKKLQRYSCWNTLNSQAIQNIAERIDLGYKRFFDNLRSTSRRHVAPPSFRKRSKYRSITFTQTGYKLLEGNRIRIGKRVYKFHKSREVEGTIKTLTIKRDTLGDFYLYFSCVVEDSQTDRTMTGKIAGFDFGLKIFLTSSDGSEIQAPLFHKKGLRSIQKASRNLSSKKRGSNNRRKARQQLARVHKKVANQRNDYQFKLARHLATTYDYLFFEDLNLDGMKRLWGRKVSDLAFDSFLQKLHYMAAVQGSSVHHIDRWFPSSKLCPECGTINTDLNLRDRIWTCECGAVHHRDRTAANNILVEGASSTSLGDVRHLLADAIAA